MTYNTAKAWWDDAMLRESELSAAEVGQRRAKVDLFFEQAVDKPSADTLLDYELFILGKMDMAEYEQYLLFKHGQQHTD
ncbi:MAG: hypothetical protein Q9M19_02590 [Mariprofundaceae bacterium]|nr:hypothetical protein [Mariprofundaceae bacterium]